MTRVSNTESDGDGLVYTIFNLAGPVSYMLKKRDTSG